jgi:hypothetical protein
MSDRNVERELSEFFRRTSTPEPSWQLREAVGIDRLREPLPRPAVFRIGRTELSLMGLAATFVIAASLLLLVAYRLNGSANLGPATCASPTATTRASATETPAPASTAVGTFTPTGTMTTARDQATATLLCDGRVLIVGGMGGRTTSSLPQRSAAPLASAELYDPSTGSFSQAGSLATARMGHTATLLPDGRVLIAGGVGAGSADAQLALASAELYDPATGKFNPTGSMASARYDSAATLLDDGRVLIAGGFVGYASLASAELYDPATGKFSPTGPMTAARAGDTATLLPDGRVLVAGGIGADIYDPKTGSFSSAGSTVLGRYLHTATMLRDGSVLLAGGRLPPAGNYNDLPALTSTELYDPKTGELSDTWSGSWSGRMAIERVHCTAALLPNGRVLLAGGSSHAAGDTATAELYNPVTGEFSSAGSMTVARSWHTATSLRDGRVLIVGGQSSVDGSESILASAELYRP